MRVHSYAVWGALLPGGGWFIAWCELAGRGNDVGTTGWGWATVLWLVALTAAYYPLSKVKGRLRQEHEWNVKRWQKLVARWEQLRYCPACDSVADLTTGRTASASDMGKLLRGA